VVYAYYLINRIEYKSNRLLIREIRSTENKRHVRLAFYPVNGYWPKCSVCGYKTEQFGNLIMLTLQVIN
jgi:hypothetical protein